MSRAAPGWLLVVIVGAALPLVVTQPVYQNVLIWICLYAVLGAAWNLLGGFTGQLSLGQAAFFGIGAYTSTILLVRYGISPLIGMWAGVALATAFAFLIGWPSLRLRGPFFGLATLAVAEVLRLSATAWTDLTNGSQGLFVPTDPNAVNLVFHDRATYLWIALAGTAVTFAAMLALSRSPLGLRLKAIREDEDAAEAIGIDSAQAKVGALMASAAVTAVCGTFYAQYLFFIDPDSVFSLNLSIQIAMVVIIGGVGHPLGPALGALVLTPFQEIVRGYLGGAYQGVFGVVYGAGLILIVILLRQGLVHLLARKSSRTATTLAAEPRSPRPAPSLPAGTPLLEARNLTKRFGGVTAVKDVSFTLRQGEILGLIGPNGAGKSTLFNLLAGALAPNSGTVTFASRPLPPRRAPHLAARLGIARTFQLVRPFSELTVAENVEAAALLRSRSGQDARALAAWALEVTGLAGERDRRAGSLALGSRKRLEIARALATEPRLLLLDEVMAGLNPAEVASMLDLVDTVRSAGVSVLMIEHLMHAVMSACERIIVLHHGELIADGRPGEIATHARVLEVYLGRQRQAVLA